MRKLLIFCFLIIQSGAVAGSSWQNYVKYNIDVKLDDSLHTLSGAEKIIYLNNSPDTLKQIHLLLYPNAYKNSKTFFARQQKRLGIQSFLNSKIKDRGYIDIHNIAVNKRPVELIIPEDSITTGYINLKSPLKPGDSLCISTEWTVKIPAPFSRFCHQGRNYFITQWFPKIPVYDSKGWHPYPYLDMGEFYYEFGDYNVNISVPDNYVVGATGTLISPESELNFLDSLSQLGNQVRKMGKKEYQEWSKNRKNKEASATYKTLKFEARNVVDFAWVASRDFLVQQGQYSYPDSSDSIRIWNYFFPENRKSWKAALAISKETLEIYGQLCGPYPYPQVTTVDGSLMAGGGMEYPMLTIINSINSQYFMRQVIGHEIGHNWFYGILGFDERRYAWMDEGLNTYGEIRLMEATVPDSVSVFSELPATSILESLYDNFNRTNLDHLILSIANYHREIQSPSLSSENFRSGLSYNASVYTKPGVGFKLLEKYAGRDKFDKAMNKFYDKWKFRHPYPEDLQNSLENSLNMDLSWLFDDYLQSIKLPDYRIKNFKISGSKSFTSSLELENLGETAQPLQISLYKNRKVVASQWIEPFTKNKSLEFKTAVKPERAIINPNLYSLEQNYYNNYSSLLPPLDINFLFNIPTPNKYMINYIPYISYNYYDGLKLGGGLYHLSHAVPKNTYLTYGSYSFKSKEINGTLLYTTNIYGEQLDYKIGGSFSHDMLKNRIGAKITFKFSDKRQIDNNLDLRFNYLDVKDSRFLEDNYWDSGNYYNTTFKHNYANKWGDTKFNSGIVLQNIYNNTSSAAYWKISGDFSSTIKIFNLIDIKNRFYCGSYLDNYRIPKQYRFYASGSPDPQFNQIYVYDRSGDTRLSPFNNYFIPGGINLKGYQTMTDGQGNHGADKWALGYNLKIESYNAFIFFDAGDIVSQKENVKLHWDAGLGVKLGLINLYFPVYLSQPYDNYDNFSDWQAMKERFLIKLNIERLNAFFGR